mgnify:CR=1 FL=1
MQKFVEIWQLIKIFKNNIKNFINDYKNGDKYFYHKGYERWRNILKKDFIENKKWLIMNCTIKEYTGIAWSGGTYRNEPTEEVIREFMKYEGLDDYNLAIKYMNFLLTFGFPAL